MVLGILTSCQTQKKLYFHQWPTLKNLSKNERKMEDETTTLKAEHIVRTRVQKNTPDETENRFPLKRERGRNRCETVPLISVLPATCQSLRLPRTSCSIHLQENIKEMNLGSYQSFMSSSQISILSLSFPALFCSNLQYLMHVLPSPSLLPLSVHTVLLYLPALQPLSRPSSTSPLSRSFT